MALGEVRAEWKFLWEISQLAATLKITSVRKKPFKWDLWCYSYWTSVWAVLRLEVSPFPAWPLSNFSLELNAPICTGSVRKWSSLQMQQALQWWAALQQGCDLPPPALNCYSSCLLFLEKNLPILALPSSWNELYETALGARCNHLCFSISLFWPKKTLQILFKHVLVLSVCGFAPSRDGSCHRVKWPYRGQVPGGMIF